MSLGLACVSAPFVALGLALGVLVPPPPGAVQPERRATVTQAACASRLPLDVRIGQTMLVITGNPAASAAALKRGRIAGLLGTGILTRTQARAFQRATRGTDYGAILGADEEGGLVQRYRNVAGRLPSAASQADSMTPAQVKAMFADHGRKLRQWGVNMVFAPVVDVGGGPGIGTRAYARDPQVVAQYAGAAAAGYRQAGLLPVIKHFPGHGRATADTHLGRSVGPDLATLRKVDLIPFRRLTEQGEVGVMVGHTQVPGYSDQPSTQAPKVITGLLREELGFRGLVVSDALGMKGTGRSQEQALVRFLKSGGDLGIVGPSGAAAGQRAVRAALASGRLSQSRIDQSAARVLAAKGIDVCRVAGANPGQSGPQSPEPQSTTGQPDGPDAPITNPTADPQ